MAASSSSVKPSAKLRAVDELVNVTATVTDKSGRFVPGLHQDDFVIYEDNVRQDVSHFSNERVPVSLGVLLDISDSMFGKRIRDAEVEKIAVANNRPVPAVRRVMQDSGDLDGLRHSLRETRTLEFLISKSTVAA